MKNLLKEINRNKKLMGLQLITEGIGDLSDFFKRLFTNGVTNMSTEERKILQDLISSSTELQSAGIRSLDNLLSEEMLILLKSVIIKNQDSIKKTFQDVAANYADESIKKINKIYASIPSIEQQIKSFDFGKRKTFMGDIKNLELNGIKSMNIDDLTTMLDTIPNIKKSFSNDTDMINYLNKISDEINSYLSSKKIVIPDSPESKVIESGKVRYSQRSIYEQKPDGTIGEIEMPSWVWNNWWKEGDIRGGGIISELKDKVSRVDNKTFNPEDVRVLNLTTDSGGRDYYELLLPTNDKVILYKSSGTGAPELKQKGDWQIINGFTSHPNDYNFFWVAKDVNSTQYTKGGSKYFTDLSNYLKSNGDNPISLLGSKSVFSSPTPPPQLGLLKNKFGDTSGIDWSKITNAKNIDDYDKLIDNAMSTGDFSMISRSGFESYGIPNFRSYLQDIYFNRVNPDYGTPVNLPSKEGPSNWYDYQEPGFKRSPYEKYGSGSN